METRSTRQKDAIRKSFTAASRPLLPDEVLALAAEWVPEISLTTVYRNIGALLKDGWLESVDLPGENRRFEVAGKGHHHHFQCTNCHKVYELAGCGVTVQQDLPPGFLVSGHDFTLYGSCGECSAA